MSETGIWKPLLGFTSPNAWSQEYFDLNLEFVSKEIGLLMDATEALWSDPDLQGCWLAQDKEPDARSRTDARSALKSDEHYPFGPPEYLGPPSLFGLARVPGGGVIPCMASCGMGGTYMYLSLGLSANALRFAPAPSGVDGGAAGRPLCDWLARIASRVHRVAPLRVGVMGWEATTPDPELIERQRELYDDLYGYLLPRGSEIEFQSPGRFSAP